jgi:hypothetical protein
MEAPRRGRPPYASLTYEKVEEISLGIQKALMGIEYLTKVQDEVTADHEVRLRALEAQAQKQSGGFDLAGYLVPILLSLPGVLLGVIALIK